MPKYAVMKLPVEPNKLSDNSTVPVNDLVICITMPIRALQTTTLPGDQMGRHLYSNLELQIAFRQNYRQMRGRMYALRSLGEALTVQAHEYSGRFFHSFIQAFDFIWDRQVKPGQTMRGVVVPVSPSTKVTRGIDRIQQAIKTGAGHERT